METGLYEDISSETYHGMKNTFSSTQLKDILEDPDLFYRKYITKELEREESSAFDVGTYFHTSILEPHLLDLTCAVFDGTRRGKEWEAFKAANAGKTIISGTEHEKVEKMVKAVNASETCKKYLTGGKPEVSAFLKVWVSGGDIFIPNKNLVLSREGWVRQKANLKASGVYLTLKVRSDYLGEDFISDLKSASGNCNLEKVIKDKVKSFNYTLSASLYLDVFSAVTGRNIDKFVWIFASKDVFNAKSWIAGNKAVVLGRARWKKAVVTLAECIRNEWKYEDSLGVYEPNNYELEEISNIQEEL